MTTKPQDQTQEGANWRAEARRANAEAAAEQAHNAAIRAANTANPKRAAEHAKRAADEARAAFTAAKLAEELAAQWPASVLLPIYAKDARQAANTASAHAGRAHHYAVNDAVREAAQARADLELCQAIAAYLQARRHRRQIGAQTPAEGMLDDHPQMIAYATAQEREKAARDRLDYAERCAEIDYDSRIIEDENPDAPTDEDENPE